MNPKDMPGWESDFWAGLMDDMNVDDRPMGSTTGRSNYGGAEKAKTSPYWTPDTLVGEIVQEQAELT